ncbi:MAG: RsiW-degrading membrane proteinase PrsW (M82 family), partial [Flavobacteriales bacterium]
MTSVLVVVIALLIGIGYLMLLRSYDIYEKEPFSVMLVVGAAGGVISVTLSLLMYIFVDVQHTFFDAVFKIGVIEEFAKYFSFYMLFHFIRNQVDEIVDGLIYISCIALGFATIENILYAFGSDSPFLTLAVRAVTSTIGHMVFSGYIGLALYIHYRVRRNTIGLIFAMIYAIAAHGIYDGLLFEHQILAFHLGFGLFIYIQWLVLKASLSFSHFRPKFSQDLFEKNGKTKKSFCSNCEIDIINPEIQFNKLKGSTCHQCDHLVFDLANWKKLMRYYRPISRRSNLIPSTKTSSDPAGKFELKMDGIYNLKDGHASIHPYHAHHWLESINMADQE